MTYFLRRTWQQIFGISSSLAGNWKKSPLLFDRKFYLNHKINQVPKFLRGNRKLSKWVQTPDYFEKKIAIRKIVEWYFSPICSDISERNNDYFDTLDFRRGWVGEVGVVTFFVLEVLDYESAMFIYIYIRSYDTGRSFEPIFMKLHGWCGSTHGWTLLFLETIGPTEPHIWGKMCSQNQFFGFKSDSMGVFEKKT